MVWLLVESVGKDEPECGLGQLNINEKKKY